MKPNLSQLKRLVGNPDAYALQNKDGSWRPMREPLTDSVLNRHLSLGHTVGTYVVYGDLARTLVLDIDDEEDTLAVSEALVGALEELGVPRTSMAVEFSGKKGHHVWVVLQEYRPAAELRRVGRAACVMAGVNVR